MNPFKLSVTNIHYYYYYFILALVVTVTLPGMLLSYKRQWFLTFLNQSVVLDVSILHYISGTVVCLYLECPKKLHFLESVTGIYSLSKLICEYGSDEDKRSLFSNCTPP